MKIRLFYFLLLVIGITASADPADDARYVARVMTKVDQGIEKARANRERPDWYVQCEIDLRELNEALPRLPDAARAPYLAKIKVYQPEVDAGVKLSRGMNLARRIRSTLDSARADLARTTIDDSIFESIDRYFAEPDAKGIPADHLKALQADYADLKKENAKKKQK